MIILKQLILPQLVLIYNFSVPIKKQNLQKKKSLLKKISFNLKVELHI